MSRCDYNGFSGLPFTGQPFEELKMHIHILGVCGTFMGGIAVLAQQAGHRVTGSDANVYPPYSDSLSLRLRNILNLAPPMNSPAH